MADQATSQRESWWVLQAQSGSHEALNELFKSVQEPLFRYLVSLVKDQNRAEDILQEVFIRIYRKLRWLLLADFSNRLHVLLLIATVSCYTIVVLGLVALGAHFNRGVARILKAVELK